MSNHKRGQSLQVSRGSTIKGKKNILKQGINDGFKWSVHSAQKILGPLLNRNRVKDTVAKRKEEQKVRIKNAVSRRKISSIFNPPQVLDNENNTNNKPDNNNKTKVRLEQEIIEFNTFDVKTPNDLLEITFERAAHCLIYPFGHVKSEYKLELSKLEQYFKFSDADRASQILFALKTFGGTEWRIHQLQEELKLIMDKKGPFTKEDFNDEQAFYNWRSLQQKRTDLETTAAKNPLNACSYQAISSQCVGRLFIGILEGKKLLKDDLPVNIFVVVKYDKSKIKTTATAQGQHAKWNEEKHFDIPIDRADRDLVIKIYTTDHNFIGVSTKSKLAELSIPSSKWRDLLAPQIEWYPLKSAKNPDAKLKIQLVFISQSQCNDLPTRKFKEIPSNLKIYQTLLEQILGVPSFNTRKNLTLISTVEMQGFIEQFCSYYGVPKSYMYLTQLDYLLTYVTEKRAHLSNIFEILVQLRKISFKTKNETKKLEETQNRLKLYCENAIQSCTKLFPDNDDDYGFDFVVKMYKVLYPNNYAKLIHDTTIVICKLTYDLLGPLKALAAPDQGRKKSNARDLAPPVALDMFTDQQKTDKSKPRPSVATKEVLHAASHVTQQVAVSLPNTPSLNHVPKYTSVDMIAIVEGLMDFVDEYDFFFQKAFPKEVNIVPTVINACYDSLEGDLKDFFALTKHTKELETIDVIEVFTTVKKAFEAWQKHDDRVKEFPLYSYAVGYVALWLEELKSKLRDWTMNARELDKWEKISKDSPHSSSCLDLMMACSQTVEFLESLFSQWDDNSVLLLLQHYGTVLGKVSVSYAESMKRSFCLELGVSEDTFDQLDKMLYDPTFQLFPNKFDFKISEKACIKLNNVEACRAYLNELVSDQIYPIYRAIIPKFKEEEQQVLSSEDYISDNFTEYFKSMKKIQNDMIDIIIVGMSTTIRSNLLTVFGYVIKDGNRLSSSWKNISPRRQGPKDQSNDDYIEEQLDPLFDYLNAHLQILTNNLYNELFLRLLRQIWLHVLDIIYKVLLIDDEKNKPSRTQIEIIHGMYQPIKRKNPAMIIIYKRYTEQYYNIGFFYAEGEGLKPRIMDRDLAKQITLLDCYSKPTKELIAELEREENSPKNSSVDMETSLYNLLFQLLVSRKKDKEALRYLGIKKPK